jgi:hypothetical protein
MKRTSLLIKNRLKQGKLATHITPGGLADETYDFVEELNREAEREVLDVRYAANVNTIEVSFGDVGALEDAARSRTLGGWFLRRSIQNGHLEGLETVLKRLNSDHRKYLRKRDKTNAGMAERDGIQDAIDARLDFRKRIKDCENSIAELGLDGIVPARWPRLWRNGLFSPVQEPHNRPTKLPAAE